MRLPARLGLSWHATPALAKAHCGLQPACKLLGRQSLQGAAVVMRNLFDSVSWLADFTALYGLRRLLLVVGDASAALLEGGNATWVHEEALGSVTETLALDLPAPGPELAARWRAEAPKLSERVHAEFLSLKVAWHPFPLCKLSSITSVGCLCLVLT